MIILKHKTLYKEWIYTWLCEKKKYVKESTYASYSNNIFNHIIPYLGNYYLHELTHQVIQSFILYLTKEGRKKDNSGLALKTIKDISNIVKSSLRQAMSEKKMNYIDLQFNYPRTYNSKSLTVLNNDEQKRLTDYIINNLNSQSVGILLGLYYGLRIGEICALRWDDIDLDRGFIYINHTIQRIFIKGPKENISKIIITTPKTVNAQRQIPLSRNFIILLRKVKGPKDTYLLTKTHNYIEPRRYRKYFNQILLYAHVKHFNFHALRHTFATNCISLGIDYKTVSEILGHANVNITLNLYVHPRLDQKKKCINLICKAIE